MSAARGQPGSICLPSAAGAWRSREPPRVRSLNCLSVDVEEYFHAEVFHGRLRPEQAAGLPRRAAPFVERIAELVEAHQSRATFFVLGSEASRLAGLLRQLVARGHEIACHGYTHEHLARLTPAALQADLIAARARIADAVGVAPTGYRAPTFSVTRRTAWALEVIRDAGFEYDASIFPIRHDRYGVPRAPTCPFWAIGPGEARVLEFPPLTLDWGLLQVPLGGGGYLRLLPWRLLSRTIAARERRQQPALIYLHPWELDPHQPRLPLGLLAQWRHRINLHRTEAKLTALLRSHRFETAARVLSLVRQRGDLPGFRLSDEGQ